MSLCECHYAGVIALNVIMLSVIILCVIMLSDVMLTVMAPLWLISYSQIIDSGKYVFEPQNLNYAHKKLCNSGYYTTKPVKAVMKAITE